MSSNEVEPTNSPTAPGDENGKGKRVDKTTATQEYLDYMATRDPDELDALRVEAWRNETPNT